MDLTSFMPRYGTLQHRRLGLLMLSLLAIAIAMLLPDLASAATFKGDFAPDQEIVEASQNSLKAWWKSLSIYGLWVSFGGLVISILFMGGRFWWVPVCVAIICLFAETLVTGVQNMMA